MKRFLIKEDAIEFLPLDRNNEIPYLKEILYFYRSQKYQVMILERRVHFVDLCIDYLPEGGIRFQCNLVARLNKLEVDMRVFVDMNQEERFLMIFIYGNRLIIRFRSPLT